MIEKQSLFPMKVENNNHEVANTTRTRKQRFKPYDKQQTYLLPSQLNDYIGKYHIARLVNALIDHIDMGCI